MFSNCFANQKGFLIMRYPPQVPASRGKTIKGFGSNLNNFLHHQHICNLNILDKGK